MRLTGDWLEDHGAQAVMAALRSGGHAAFFVGGCVRNAVIGLPVADIDIATAARPERVAQVVEAAGLRPVPTGIEHGTVTVVADGTGYEVTTFRRDVETDGRHAVILFADRVEEDAARRDFTMNALYATAGGELVDPLGGLPDAMARKVRFIGDPHARIREDFLRILRFFRFNALYGDPGLGLDAEGLAACAAEVDGLDGLSRERVGSEMRKLLGAPDPCLAAAGLAASGALSRVLPGADTRPLAPLVAIEQALELPPSALRRLAAVGGEAPAERLRLSRAESRHLDRIRQAQTAGDPPRVAAYRHGAEVATDALLVSAAMGGAVPAREALSEVARGAAAVFPVRAADLPEGIEGVEIGRRLKAIEERWLASGLTLDRATLLG